MASRYCAGHLIEAGVAHYDATGQRDLLNVAIKFADLLDATYGPGKRLTPPGHQEPELALAKLYQATGEARYLKPANFFLEQRGNANRGEPGNWYEQDHIRRVDVPGSEFAFALGEQQIRYLSVTPQSNKAIEKNDFVKGPDSSAPMIMAVTVEPT